MRRLGIIALIILFTASGSAGPTEVHIESGPARVALIELFTSEGCSSCPPAEKWLNQLRTDERLWNTFVPVAFHVSYWNRLGWRDRFAKEQFTQREYALANSWGTRTVYTPCFVRDGNEWRSRDLETDKSAEAGKLEVFCDQAGTVRAIFTPSIALVDGALELHVALLGSGLTSSVRAGENAGSRLEHEFVALNLLNAPMTPRDAATVFEASVAKVTDARDPQAVRHALAVWVTRLGQFGPIQAAGGWLP